MTPDESMDAFVLLEYQREHRDRSEVWRDLDRKSQVAAAMAAAAVAWTTQKGPDSSHPVDDGLLGLQVISLICLLGTLGLVARALRVVHTPTPPDGRQIHQAM